MGESLRLLMLKVMDMVSAGMGLRINASKTEIMAIKLKPKKGRVEEEAEEVVISEGVVKVVSQFKSWQCACS